MSDDKTPELMPCPFCGGDDIHVFSVNRRDKSRLYPFVRCMDCYLDLPGENEDYSPEGKTAIAAWNRRAAFASDAREIALLEAAKRVSELMLPASSQRKSAKDYSTGLGVAYDAIIELIAKPKKG